MAGRTSSGTNSIRFDRRNPADRSTVVGLCTRPAFQATATVSPSRNASARSIRTPTSVPAFSISAACSCDPYPPLNAEARTPATPDGSRIRVATDSIGTSHSSPVTFQYSSSYSSKNRSALATSYRITTVRVASTAPGTRIFSLR